MTTHTHPEPSPQHLILDRAPQTFMLPQLLQAHHLRLFYGDLHNHTGYSDGTFAAYDDESLERLWKINMGAGYTSPPMTFFAGDRQFVAISTGLSRIARGMLGKSPEVAEMRNSTVLYVFTVD